MPAHRRPGVGTGQGSPETRLAQLQGVCSTGPIPVNCWFPGNLFLTYNAAFGKMKF